ncbi:TrkH family potassium uptake protein [Rubritalea marina]|uniref:TrkH family potassium uptake protein n=1 Tax=Rubritalea marina TaxID=361055 RepID=UPI00035F6CE0|nr:TrkH family potassium uptake protein [Rubritalea marina]
MNFRILGKILGALLILLSAAMLLCALFTKFDVHCACPWSFSALAKSSGITAAVGAVMMALGWGPIEKIPRREGVVIVGLGWILSGVFGGLPYMLSEPAMPVVDALFESISGFTTTGSTVMTDIEAWPRGLLMWRSLTQWLGGLGILVLFVALLSYLGVGTKSLFRNESSFQTGEASTARIRDTALNLWRVYLLITMICALGLKAMGLTWYNAVSHSFTAVSTGGFSPHNASIGHYSDWGNGWLIELWLSLFMLMCSVSFLIWVILVKKRWKRLRAEEEGKWFVLICFVSSLMIAVGIAANQLEGFLPAMRDAWFMVVSIASTTGFGTVDYEQWPGFALILLAMLMFMGGCSGSTAGGMKVSRLLVMLRSARFEVVKAFRPHKVFKMQVNGNSIDANGRSQTVIFVCLYGFLVILSSFVMGILEFMNDIDMVTAVGAVLATLPNIGPGFGECGPTKNFAHFMPLTKLFLSLLMILGRLELYAVLVLFVPSLWRKY